MIKKENGLFWKLNISTNHSYVYYVSETLSSLNINARKVEMESLLV